MADYVPIAILEMDFLLISLSGKKKTFYHHFWRNVSYMCCDKKSAKGGAKNPRRNFHRFIGKMFSSQMGRVEWRARGAIGSPLHPKNQASTTPFSPPTPLQNNYF